MKNTVLAFILLTGLISCSRSDTEKSSGILMGKFIELAPENGRAELEFQSDTHLILRTNPNLDDRASTTFTIKLLDNGRLDLSCNECDQLVPFVVSYKILDHNTFEISNLYGGFSEIPSDIIMTFKRK